MALSIYLNCVFNYVSYKELCLSEFLSLFGSGWKLATRKFAQNFEGRREAALCLCGARFYCNSHTLSHICWLPYGHRIVSAPTSPWIPTLSCPSSFSAPEPNVCLAPWQRTQLLLQVTHIMEPGGLETVTDKGSSWPLCMPYFSPRFQFVFALHTSYLFILPDYLPSWLQA